MLTCHGCYSALGVHAAHACAGCGVTNYCGMACQALDAQRHTTAECDGLRGFAGFTHSHNVSRALARFRRLPCGVEPPRDAPPTAQGKLGKLPIELQLYTMEMMTTKELTRLAASSKYFANLIGNETRLWTLARLREIVPQPDPGDVLAISFHARPAGIRILPLFLDERDAETNARTGFAARLITHAQRALRAQLTDTQIRTIVEIVRAHTNVALIGARAAVSSLQITNITDVYGAGPDLAVALMDVLLELRMSAAEDAVHAMLAAVTEDKPAIARLLGETTRRERPFRLFKQDARTFIEYRGVFRETVPLDVIHSLSYRWWDTKHRDRPVENSLTLIMPCMQSYPAVLALDRISRLVIRTMGPRSVALPREFWLSAATRLARLEITRIDGSTGPSLWRIPHIPLQGSAQLEALTMDLGDGDDISTNAQNRAALTAFKVVDESDGVRMDMLSLKLYGGSADNITLLHDILSLMHRSAHPVCRLRWKGVVFTRVQLAGRIRALEGARRNALNLYPLLPPPPTGSSLNLWSDKEKRKAGSSGLIGSYYEMVVYWHGQEGEPFQHNKEYLLQAEGYPHPSVPTPLPNDPEKWEVDDASSNYSSDFSEEESRLDL